MVSQVRRKSRSHLFGATIRTGSRHKGGVNPGGHSEVTLGNLRRAWECGFNQNPCWPYWPVFVRDTGLPPPVARFDMSHRRAATEGAEKSCRIRRRKRGLRRGKSRSRGCQPRRTSPLTANISKTPSARKINHIGRKYIWARQSANALRDQCERYNKFPRGPLSPQHPASAPRKKMKEYLMTKWQRLSDRATAAGIPPVAAFHASFWKFLLVETSRGRG
jgi:hypothetical protein